MSGWDGLVEGEEAVKNIPAVDCPVRQGFGTIGPL